MTDTKRDIFTEIDDELDAYDQLYGAGMTHEEGFDFARRWNLTLCAALKEIITLRVERTAALAEIESLRRVADAARDDLKATRDAALAERDRLITTIEFYASPVPWTKHVLEGNWGDYGDKAREVLASLSAALRSEPPTNPTG